MANQKIHRPIQTVRMRLRAQRVLEGLTTGFIGTFLLWMVLLVLYKTRWLPSADLFTYGALGLVFPIAGLIWAFVHKIDNDNVALSIDESNHLKGRLTSAHTFLQVPEDERSAFMQAAIDDALEHVGDVDVSPAAPFAAPRDGLAFVLVAAALLTVLVFRPPVLEGTLPPIVDPVIEVKAIFDDEDLQRERDAWEETKKSLQESDDPEAQRMIGQMDDLFEKLEQKKLDKDKFLSEVDKVQKEFFKDRDDQWKPLLDELKKINDEFEDKDLTKDVAKALENKDLNALSKALDDIAKKVEDGKVSDKDLEQLAKKLERMASKFEKDASQIEDMLKKKEKELERLKKQYEAKKKTMSDKEKKRFSRLERDLKKLKKKASSYKKSSKGRASKKLSKAMKEASNMARSVKNRGKGAGKNKEARAKAKQNFKNNVKQASKELRTASKDVKRERAMDKANKQLANMKEKMRRSGDSTKQQMASKQNFNQRAKGQKPSDKDGAKGQQGVKQGQKMEGAAGKDGPKVKPPPGASKDGGPGKQGKGKGPLKESESTGKNDKEGGPQGKGRGQGKGGDDKPLGKEAEALKNAKFKDTKISGKQGDGPSQEEVILSAASKGFASTGYKDVYVEYEKVMEEVLETEEIPPGYQFYVQEYFKQIRPREEATE